MPAPDSDVPEQVASDAIRKAAALGDRMVEIGEAGRLEEAIALCDEMATRFGTHSQDSRIRYQIAHALRNKVRCLNRLERTDEAAKLCGEIASAYAGDENEAIREIAATTASWAAVAAYQREDLDETISICEEYVADLIDDASQAVREQAILMLGVKASTLAELGRAAEALTAIDDFLEHATNNPTPMVQERIEDAQQLRASLADYEGFASSLSDRFGPLAPLRVALLASKNAWLCLPEGAGPVEAEMAFMHSCTALYDHLSVTHPDMATGSQALAMLQEIADETIREATGSRMPAAMGSASGPFSNGVAEAIAAARLAAAGSAREVLVATSIMSQGLDCEWPWTHQPGTPGHLWLLPAISSVLSPDDQFEPDVVGVGVPPCFYSGGMAVLVQLDPEFRALRPGVSDADRSEFFEWAAGAKSDLLYDDGLKTHFCLHDVDTTIQLVTDVAAALGIDPDCVAGLGPTLDKRLANLREGGDDLDDQAAVEAAHLMYWAASESHQLLLAGDDLESVARDHPWVIDWYPAGMPWGAWPPDRAVLLHHLQGSTPHSPSAAGALPTSWANLQSPAAKVWQDAQSEWTCEGRFNVESGAATVATSLSYPSCGCFDSGDDGHSQPDCEICGRPAGNRFGVGSGAGDGFYPVYRLVNEQDDTPHGAIAVFDETEAGHLDTGVRGPSELLEHSEPVWLGTVKSEGSLSFSEAYTGTDSDNAVVTVPLPEGTFHVVAWMGDVTAYGTSWGSRAQALAVYDEPTMASLAALSEAEAVALQPSKDHQPQEQ